MSSRRQWSIPLGGRYKQVSLYYESLYLGRQYSNCNRPLCMIGENGFTPRQCVRNCWFGTNKHYDMIYFYTENTVSYVVDIWIEARWFDNHLNTYFSALRSEIYNYGPVINHSSNTQGNLIVLVDYVHVHVTLLLKEINKEITMKLTNIEMYIFTFKCWLFSW